jgi:hypothetical protein
MSSIGGSLRTGELTGSDPIRHALKLEVWSRYLYDDAATGGRRWPALRANSGALTRYRGSVPALRMGALLALPPRATAERLGVRSAAGRKIVAALRDYGGYVVDDSSLDAVDLCVEHGAAADVVRRTGHALEADPALQADMARIVAALAVVDDNGPASVGGHGARRAPWAPPLRTAGSRGAASTTRTETTRTATPAPSPLPIEARQVAEVEPARDAPTVAVDAVAATALLLLALGLWGGRRLAGGRVTPRRGP